MSRLLLLIALLSGLIGCEKSVDNIQITQCEDLILGCDIGVGKITFSQIPKPLASFIIVFKPLKSDVNLSLVKAQFNMQGMQMGFNQYRFIQEKTGIWQANVILPVCMQGRADWLMTLEITENSKQKKLMIPFKSS